VQTSASPVEQLLGLCEFYFRAALACLQISVQACDSVSFGNARIFHSFQHINFLTAPRCHSDLQIPALVNALERTLEHPNPCSISLRYRVSLPLVGLRWFMLQMYCHRVLLTGVILSTSICHPSSISMPHANYIYPGISLWNPSFSLYGRRCVATFSSLLQLLVVAPWPDP
jgi:hypothetical protein